MTDDVQFGLKTGGPAFGRARRRRFLNASIGGAGEPAGGLGLGLAIAKQFVELLGGTISGAPRPGGGATFTIVLPCATELPALGKSSP